MILARALLSFFFLPTSNQALAASRLVYWNACQFSENEYDAYKLLGELPQCDDDNNDENLRQKKAIFTRVKTVQKLLKIR